MKSIQTKYHGVTNTKPARYSATDGDHRIYLSTDYELSGEGNHDRAAIALCRKLGWVGAFVRGGNKQGNVYVFVRSENIIVVLEEK